MASVELVNPAGRSLLFVCPAWERVDLARVCYRQFAAMLLAVEEFGLEADVLVVADDANLDAAQQAGLSTLELDNRLGARLNAGYTYAHEEGYDYVCAVGNDSWMHPDRFLWLPDEQSLLCTRNYTSIVADGSEQVWLKLTYDGGTGSRVIPISWLKGCDYKPLDPYQMSGCDTGTLLAMCRGVERAPHLIYTDLHAYEVLGFQSDVQITNWDHFTAHFLHERQPAFHRLDDHYPAELVDAIRAHYASLVPA